MDLSYATIPLHDGTLVRLDREKYRRYHVEDPVQPRNESMNMMGEDLSSNAILAFSVVPKVMEDEDEVRNNTSHLEELHDQPLRGSYEKERSTLDHTSDFFPLTMGNKEMILYS
jgi:hypothetical protein